MDAYLTEAIDRRRRKPGDDLITSFVQASEDGSALTGAEIVALVRLLLIAGNETTTRLLGLLMNALLRHPGQLEQIQRAPEIAQNAVEEALRFEGPVVPLTRRTSRPVTLSGHAVPAGTLVSPVIASANHDEDVFPNAGVFDVTRRFRRHLALGGGIHACVGAPIARVETRIALEELVHAMDRFRPAGPAVRCAGFLRGFERLPLSFVPRVTPPERPSAPWVATGSHP
jgi:cytochrome P450